MKSLTLKLLTILVALNISLWANPEEEKVLSFFKNAIAASADYELKKIVILKKEPLEEAKGFHAYFVKIDLTLKAKKKDISISDIVFTNGEVLTKDFLYLETKKSMKNSLTLDVDASFYDKAHLIEGSIEAKNKLLVFSDPLCPSCMEVIPELIHFTKENSKDFALYYYNFPLSIHKGADTLVKAMIKAKQDGVKDITLKVYEEVFELEKTDEQSVLDTFNKAIGTKYTLAQIDTKEIRAILEQDIQKAKDILVKGTPTLFINGKRDMSKKAYKDMVK